MAYNLFFFRRFWVKEPRRSETISHENSYLCPRTRSWHIVVDKTGAEGSWGSRGTVVSMPGMPSGGKEERRVHLIKVASAGVSPEALHREFGEGVVARATRKHGRYPSTKSRD